MASQGQLKNGLLRLVRRVPWLTHDYVEAENHNFERALVSLQGGYGIIVEQVRPGVYRISLDQEVLDSIARTT